MIPVSLSGSDKPGKELEIEERTLDIALRQSMLTLLESG